MSKKLTVNHFNITAKLHAEQNTSRNLNTVRLVTPHMRTNKLGKF